MKVENIYCFRKGNLTFSCFFTKYIKGMTHKAFLNKSKKTSFS